MSTTPNMSLIVPDVGTSGPAYATQINTAMDVIDAHDHTASKGARIPPSGLNINADLPFNGNDAITLRSTRYVAQTGVLAASDDRNCVSSVNGNLYWNNANGIPVQITAGNGLNFASLGTIGGDYGAAGVTASAIYTNTLQTFSWLQSANVYAKVGTGDLSLYATVAGSQAVTLKANSTTSAYNITMPTSAPAANTFMRMAVGGQGTFVTLNGTANQITVTQNTSDMTVSIPTNPILPGNASATGTITTAVGFAGPGMVPIGAIIPIGDAGAWALPASGAIKDGYALCNGQAKPAGSAAGLAATLPNLSDDRFLNGSTVPGGIGGANSKSPTFNKNVMNADQTAHSHGMDHRHIWMNYPAPGAAGGNGEFSYNSYKYDGSITTWINSYYGVTSGSSKRASLYDLTGDYYVGTSLYTSGSLNLANVAGAKTSTDNASVSWASATVTVSIADVRPSYFNVVYVMRVA